MVLSGECFFGSDEHKTVKAGATDIVVVPNGDSHWIADSPGRSLVPSSRAGEACELGSPLFQDGKITNRIMCGMVEFDQGATHPIVNALPQFMHFSMLELTGPVWSLVNLIEVEMREQSSGGSRIADRLCEALFLQLLNRYVIENQDETGFLAALRDRRVSRALALIHRQPETSWTLELLGDKVGMSRATLVRRFQDVVGVAPMTYIADWRLMKAHNLVRFSTTPFEQIAASTGFASARTLSRAFQRQYGSTPAQLRRIENSQ